MSAYVTVGRRVMSCDEEDGGAEGAVVDVRADGGFCVEWDHGPSTWLTPRANVRLLPCVAATYHRVVMTLCSLCIDGTGGQCHSPGCALWINRAPDLSLRDNPMVEAIDGAPLDYETMTRAPGVTERVEPKRGAWKGGAS